MITLESLSFKYEDARQPALHELSLEVPAGEILGIVGTEGSGRTSLFRVLNGTAPRCFPGTLEGQVRVCGFDPQLCSHSDLGAHVSSIFDDPDSQIISLTVEEEISFALVQRGLPFKEIELRVQETLARVGLAGFERRATASLSGGQKQRLILASALALRPKLLLIDEGTHALDPEAARLCFELVRELVEEEGSTALFFERDMELLLEYADRVMVLDKGTSLCCEQSASLCQRAQELKALGLRLPAWLDLSAELLQRGVLELPLPSNEEEAVAVLEPLCKARVPA